MNSINIAIDGPAGVGKTTVGEKLAGHLSFLFIESGMLYRALAFADLKGLPQKKLRLTAGGGTRVNIRIGDRSLKGELDSEEIGEKASKLATKKRIRRLVTAEVREYAQGNNVVVEGRDIGTVVLPSADLKIFLKASPKARAKRRWNQLDEKKKDLQGILKDIKKRDNRDKEREIAPLKPAEDAFIIDTTDSSQKETVQKTVELAEKILDIK